jgi:hypothetical protein
MGIGFKALAGEGTGPPEDGVYKARLISAELSEPTATRERYMAFLSFNDGMYAWKSGVVLPLDDGDSFVGDRANAAIGALPGIGKCEEPLELEALLDKLVGRTFEVKTEKDGEWIRSYVERELPAEQPAAAAAAAPAPGSQFGDEAPY